MAKRTPAKTAALDSDARFVVLHGSEPMLMQQHLDQLAASLEKAHGELQRVQLDGGQASLADVLDELRSYSLMQLYKLVIVDDAEHFVGEATRDALTRYAQNPVDHATLVLRAGRWYAGNLDKAIAKVGAVIKCQPLKPAEAVSWLRQRAKHHHRATLDSDAAQALVDRQGTGLALLDSELGKLTVAAGEDQAITRELVESVCGRSSDEKAWVVQAAMLQAMAQQPVGAGVVIEKVHELIELSGQPAILIGYTLADLMRKILLASWLMEQRASRGQIAKQLRVFGDQQNLFFQVAQRISPPQAQRLLKQAIAVDHDSKSGRGDPVRNIECFCIALADEMNKRRAQAGLRTR